MHFQTSTAVLSLTGTYKNNYLGIQVFYFQSEAGGNEVVREIAIVSRSQLDTYKCQKLKLYD